jgi:AraC-like DNA-binding protein
MPCAGLNTQEEAMSAAESYTRFIAERAKPPPLTSGVTRHWDGRGIASQGVGPTPLSAPEAHVAVPAQEQPGLERRASPPMTTWPLGLIPASPTAVDWATEAAGMIFYLHPDLLLASLHSGVPAATGVLLWVYTETTLPLSEIGQRIGYADQSHFTALFRKHVATTPQAYRDATHRG